MKNRLFIVIFILFSGFAVHPCDNKREGLFAGGGLGFGLYYSNQTYHDFDNSFTKPSFLADVKIGATLNGGYHSIYFNAKEALVFSAETSSNQDETLMNNLFSIGYSYYLNGNIPEGFYFSGGIGLALFSVVDDIGNIAAGPGFFIEAGYEFYQHFTASFFVMYSNTEKESLKTNSVASGILISGILY